MNNIFSVMLSLLVFLDTWKQSKAGFSEELFLCCWLLSNCCFAGVQLVSLSCLNPRTHCANKNSQAGNVTECHTQSQTLSSLSVIGIEVRASFLLSTPPICNGLLTQPDLFQTWSHYAALPLFPPLTSTEIMLGNTRNQWCGWNKRQIRYNSSRKHV